MVTVTANHNAIVESERIEESGQPSVDDNPDVRLIRRLQISGLLSFGPQGIDLPLEPLNVLIGPNGSGKSNFIEALALLQAAPRNLPAPVKAMGGIWEWLWKGDGAPATGRITAFVNNPQQPEMPLRHTLEIAESGGRLEVADECIENAKPYPGHTDAYFYYRYQQGDPVINNSSGEPRELGRGSVHPEESILSQRGEDPDYYPVLHQLREQYGGIRLYRNWELGPDAGLRRSPRSDAPSTFLMERGQNLVSLLSKLRGDHRQEFVKSLQQLYDGVVGFHIEVGDGRAELFVVEKGRGERYIPASRLSDGTLRYMTLAAILLDPNPPPLLVIEEPELGLHPDVLLDVGHLVVKASRRTQLVVTTHSPVLIDALDDCPMSLVVCENYEGESLLERPDAEYLKKWLQDYSLGKLWTAGDLGGNRW